MNNKLSILVIFVLGLFSLSVGGCRVNPTNLPTQQEASSVLTVEALASATSAISTVTVPVQASATSNIFPTSTPTQSPPTATIIPAVTIQTGGSIYVDHHSLALFNQIPDEYIQAASNVRLLVRHASVGVNISFGLDCLMNYFPDRESPTIRPYACDRDLAADQIIFNSKYDRSQWVFQPRGNPGWIEKLSDFIEQTDLHHDEYDAFTFLFGYVDALDEGNFPNIADPENYQKVFSQLEALEAKYPGKIFIWWTVSLARVPQVNTQKINTVIREYAAAHNKILIDIADIESHDLEGNLSTDSRNIPVLYEGYTEEIRAGHLNSLGRSRMTQAMWVLMAQVAGWKP